MPSELISNHLTNILELLNKSTPNVTVDSTLIAKYTLGLTKDDSEGSTFQTAQIIKLSLCIISQPNFSSCKNYETLVELLPTILLKMKFRDIVSLFDDSSLIEFTGEQSFFGIFNSCIYSPFDVIQRLPFEILTKTTDLDDLLSLDNRIISLIFTCYIDDNMPLSVIGSIDNLFDYLISFSKNQDIMNIYFSDDYFNLLSDHCYVENKLNITLQLRVLDLSIKLVRCKNLFSRNIKHIPHFSESSDLEIDYWVYVNKYLEFLNLILKDSSDDKVIDIFQNDIRLLVKFFLTFRGSEDFKSFCINEFFMLFNNISFAHYNFFLENKILPVEVFSNLNDPLTKNLLACVNPKYFYSARILDSSYFSSLQISNKVNFEILCNLVKEEHYFFALTSEKILTVKSIKSNLTWKNVILFIEVLSKFQLDFLINHFSALVHEYILDDDLDISDTESIAISTNFENNQLRLQVIQEILRNLKSRPDIKTAITEDLICQKQKLISGDIYSSTNFRSKTQGLIETAYQ